MNIINYLSLLRFFCNIWITRIIKTMKIFILSYVSAFIVMLPLDAFWLFFATSRVYKPRIGHLLAAQPDLLAAGLFYLLYVAGMVFFVILPDIRSGATPFYTFIHGAFFGLVAYATFDLTSQALLRDWSWQVTMIDLIWGSLLTGTVVLSAVIIVRYFS